MLIEERQGNSQMNYPFRRILTLVCLPALLLVLMMSSCRTTYIRGKEGSLYILTQKVFLYEVQVPHDVATTYQACLLAYQDLKLTPQVNRQDAFSALLEAQFADNVPCKVTIKKLGPDLSNITIYVGETRNRARVMELFNRIREHLEK